MTFRYLTPVDINEMARLFRYAFKPNKNNFEDIEIDKERDSKVATRTLGLFDDDTLKACIMNLDYKLFLRGIWLKTAAVAAIACGPEHRRQGFITQLFSRLFRDMNKENQFVSALYPFHYPFYEKFGYQVAADNEIITIPTNQIKTKPVKNIKAKLVEEQEFFEAASKVYNNVVQGYNFIFHRTEDMWKQIIKNKKGFKYIFYQEEGNPVAYVILNFKKFVWKADPEDKSVIRLDEFFWETPLAKQAVFNLLKNHDSQRKFIEIFTFDRYIHAYIKDIESLKRQIWPGIMFRIVNAKFVLEKIHYPDSIDGSFTFSLTDNHCPWNNKIFLVEIKESSANVNDIPHNSTATKEIQLDFKIDIGSLSQLIAGYLNYDELVESEDIIKYSDNQIPSKVFPVQINSPRDFF